MSHLGKVIVYGPYDKVDDQDEHTVFVNPTSRSRDPEYRQLSPFFLGPVDVDPFGDGQTYTSRTFENAWQYLKLYAQHQEDVRAYLEWARRGWASPRAHRFPMGKGAQPLCSLWKGARLGYIEARFNIYAPLYEYCVETYQAPVLKRLQDLYHQGKTIALFDFDGYHHVHNKMTLRDVIYNSHRKMGHGFVLAGLITGEKPWREPYDPAKQHKTPVKRSC